MLMYNSFFRFFMEGYLQFTISCLLCFKNLDISSSLKVANLIVASIFTIIVIALPVFAFIFLFRNLQNLKQKEIKKKYESLYLEVDTTKRNAYLFSTLFLLRRLIYGVTLIFVPILCLQLGIIILTSFIMLIFLVKYNPFHSKINNFVEIVNETTFITLVYISYGFNDLYEKG